MELSHISDVLFREKMELFAKDRNIKKEDRGKEPKDKKEIRALRFDPSNHRESKDLENIFENLNTGDTKARADYIFLAHNEKENSKKQIIFFLIETTDLLWEFQDKYTDELKSGNSEDEEELLISLGEQIRGDFIKKFVGSVEILCCLDGVCTQFKDEKTDAEKLNAKELRKFMEDNKELCHNKTSNLCRGEYIIPKPTSIQSQQEDDQCWLCRNWHQAKINEDGARNKFFYTVLVPNEQDTINSGWPIPSIRAYTYMYNNINRNLKETVELGANSIFVSMIGNRLLCSYEIFADEAGKYTDSKKSL